MPRPKNPNAVVLTQSQGQESRLKVQQNLRLAPELSERLKNIAWATGVPIQAILEEATLAAVEKRERQYQKEHGTAVPARPNAKLE